ncbi:MAG: hypothetical protein HQL19_07025 [Candidatus Omnitrophica bacterium]|nr:hypothetical protein [Candidatus Omnitrophota bacterium]
MNDLKKTVTFRLISSWIIVSFIASAVIPPRAYAQSFNLPAPGAMVLTSPAYMPVMVKGIKVHPENPLLFDFILDTGKSGLRVDSPEFKTESRKLIKYFLASLTIKEDDLWVNLSPYEKDRMITEELGKTELGRDMLAQDYILKQLTASLIYPEKELGKKFWDRVYAKAQEQFGSTDVPVDTFNKVWIVADKAKVLERNNTGYVVGAHLKVMLEEDYVALEKQTAASQKSIVEDNKAHTVASQIIREIVIPEIEKEVNEGQNFAPLRQMFYSMILASWYKIALKDALLNQVYSNKGKTAGVLSDDPAVKEKIYNQYLQAYKKGVFNYIKEDMNMVSNQPMPRKYFSGGERMRLRLGENLTIAHEQSRDDAPLKDGDLAMASVQVAGKSNSEYATDIKKNVGDLILQGQEIIRQFEPPTYSETRAGNVYNALWDMLGKLSASVQHAETKADWKNIKQILASDATRRESDVLALSSWHLSFQSTYGYNQREELRGRLLKVFENVVTEVGLAADAAMTANLKKGLDAPREIAIKSASSASQGDRAMAPGGSDLNVKNMGLDISADFQKASSRVQATQNFQRLSDILGFTGMGVDAERKHIKEISVVRHDIRTAKVASEVASRLGLNAPRAFFIGLVHDYGAFPFRHITMQSQLKQVLLESGYNSKSHLVSLLQQDGFNLPEDLIRDLLNFDIAKTDQMSQEGAVAIASESIEGVIEDIFFGLKYRMISFSDIPQSLKEALLLQSITENQLLENIEKDFDGVTVRIANNVLLGGEISVKAVVDRARILKQQARDQIIVAKIFNNVNIDVKAEVAKAEPLIMSAYRRALQSTGSVGKEGMLKALDALSRLGETTLLRDAAMSGANGGIDLNAKNMGLDVRKEGRGIEMKFEPDMVAEFQKGNFAGVEGIIFRIVPIQSPLPILGLETTSAEGILAKG